MITITTKSAITLTLNEGNGDYNVTAQLEAQGHISNQTVAIKHRKLLRFWRIIPVSELIVNGQTFTDALAAADAINLLNANFNSGGSGSGSLVIPEDYFFASVADRDIYFSTHPNELINGVQVVTGLNPAILWQYNGTSWQDVTAIIRGPQGQPGPQGPQGEPGSSGGDSAANTTVDDSGFTNLEGTNVQDVLNDIDQKIGQGGSDNIVEYDTNGNIIAGETLLGQFTDTSEIWGNQGTNTLIASFDRPEVLNPSVGIKQSIINPDLFTWANGNADFKDPSPKGWRIPSFEEMNTLIIAGKGIWIQINNIYGRYLGSGTNCFFPASGNYDIINGLVNNQNIYGRYWLSTPHSNSNGNYIYVNQGNADISYISYINGYTIRCVRDASITDFDPCPAGEFQVGNIVWAKSNLSDVGVFAQNPEDYGAYFQWGQNVAIGGDGLPLSIRHKIAYIEDIPTPPSTVRFNVTNMFTFNPAVTDAKVWMRDDGQQKPEIEIIANNSSNNTNDLVITSASGFGSWYDLTGMKAIQALGKDIETGASGIYDITITGETDQVQTVITIPKEVNNVDFIYFLGKTTALRASYFIDWENITRPFELGNTPITALMTTQLAAITINGEEWDGFDISSMSFGDSYLSITEIPDGTSGTRGFMSQIGDGSSVLDIRGLKNVTYYGNNAFAESYFSILQVGNTDASIINYVGNNVFLGRTITHIHADTQAGGEAFKAKFPNLVDAIVVVNS